MAQLVGVARKCDEATAVVQESAKDPGEAVQKAEIGEGTGTSQNHDDPAGQGAVSSMTKGNVRVIMIYCRSYDEKQDTVCRCIMPILPRPSTRLRTF
jgi:hypothetical protein